jgi:hypothetical protein
MARTRQAAVIVGGQPKVKAVRVDEARASEVDECLCCDACVHEELGRVGSLAWSPCLDCGLPVTGSRREVSAGVRLALDAPGVRQALSAGDPEPFVEAARGLRHG